MYFLEHDLRDRAATHRADRFQAAYALDRDERREPLDTPWVMVDSGYLTAWGALDYPIEFRRMIDRAMPRPAGARVHLRQERPVPSTLALEAQITNTGDVPLDAAVNGAAAHFVAFIGHRAMRTGREILGVGYRPFDEPLLPGETRRLSFTLEGLRGVNLSQADALVIVDAQPDPATGRWEMLQAAAASSAELPAMPTALPTATPPPTRTPRPTRTPEPLPTEIVEAPTPTLYLPAALRMAALDAAPSAR